MVGRMWVSVGNWSGRDRLGDFSVATILYCFKFFNHFSALPKTIFDTYIKYKQISKCLINKILCDRHVWLVKNIKISFCVTMKG